MREEGKIVLWSCDIPTTPRTLLPTLDVLTRVQPQDLKTHVDSKSEGWYTSPLPCPSDSTLLVSGDGVGHVSDGPILYPDTLKTL